MHHSMNRSILDIFPFLSRLSRIRCQDTERDRELLADLQGGIHKRIDENRELLLLLQREAGMWLHNNPSILKILNDHDEFLCTIHNHYPGLAKHMLGQFNRRSPRPWPGPLSTRRTEYIARHPGCPLTVEILSSHLFEAQSHTRLYETLTSLGGIRRRLTDHAALQALLSSHQPLCESHPWMLGWLTSQQIFFTHCESVVERTPFPNWTFDRGKTLP